jgi:hypothetical protein
VVKVERVTIPAALLVCPPDPAPRPIASQRDVARQLETAMAALRACRANMREIRQLNQGAKP